MAASDKAECEQKCVPPDCDAFALNLPEGKCALLTETKDIYAPTAKGELIKLRMSPVSRYEGDLFN